MPGLSGITRTVGDDATDLIEATILAIPRAYRVMAPALTARPLLVCFPDYRCVRQCPRLRDFLPVSGLWLLPAVHHMYSMSAIFWTPWRYIFTYFVWLAGQNYRFESVGSGHLKLTYARTSKQYSLLLCCVTTSWLQVIVLSDSSWTEEGRRASISRTIQASQATK